MKIFKLLFSFVVVSSLSLLTLDAASKRKKRDDKHHNLFKKAKQDDKQQATCVACTKPLESKAGVIQASCCNISMHDTCLYDHQKACATHKLKQSATKRKRASSEVTPLDHGHSDVSAQPMTLDDESSEEKKELKEVMITACDGSYVVLPAAFFGNSDFFQKYKQKSVKLFDDKEEFLSNVFVDGKELKTFEQALTIIHSDLQQKKSLFTTMQTLNNLFQEHQFSVDQALKFLQISDYLDMPKLASGLTTFLVNLDEKEINVGDDKLIKELYARCIEQSIKPLIASPEFDAACLHVLEPYFERDPDDLTQDVKDMQDEASSTISFDLIHCYLQHLASWCERLPEGSDEKSIPDCILVKGKVSSVINLAMVYGTKHRHQTLDEQYKNRFEIAKRDKCAAQAISILAKREVKIPRIYFGLLAESPTLARIFATKGIFFDFYVHSTIFHEALQNIWHPEVFYDLLIRAKNKLTPQEFSQLINAQNVDGKAILHLACNWCTRDDEAKRRKQKMFTILIQEAGSVLYPSLLLKPGGFKSRPFEQTINYYGKSQYEKEIAYTITKQLLDLHFKCLLTQKSEPGEDVITKAYQELTLMLETPMANDERTPLDYLPRLQNILKEITQK